MNARALLAVLIVALAALVPAAAAAEVPADLLAYANADGAVRVIAKLYAPDMVPEAVLHDDRWAVLLQRLDIVDLQDAALSTLSGTAYQVIWRYATSPYMALEVTPDALIALGASPFIEEIAEDFEIQPRMAQSGPLVQAPDAHAIGVTGEGQTVVIIDDGIQSSHPFFGGRVVDEWCIVSTAGGCPSGPQGPAAAAPSGTHGTHVAGIAAGAGTSFSGVASRAGIIAIRVFQQNSASLADVKAALDHVIVLKDSRTIAAVNMSLGADGFLSSGVCDGVDTPYGMKADIDTLRAAGIATVVATGNDGSPTRIGYPACISSTIKAGATTRSGTIASYSNRAPALESSTLLAPGGDGPTTGAGNLCSSRANAFLTPVGDCPGSGVGGPYGYASGTSMATPHITGAWALLKQVKPTATVGEVLAALRASGVAVTDSLGGTSYRRILVRDAIGVLTGLQVALAADRASPQPVGVTVRFTASRSGGVGNVTYKWRVFNGSTWSVARDWSTTSAFDWTPSAPGTYTIQVSGRSGVITADVADGPAAIGSASFTIAASRVPTITGLSPTSTTAGGSGFTLTVDGSDFVGTSVVQWNGAARPTVVSGTQLRASITAADVSAGGTASVTAMTPGAGTSSALTFTINNPVPTISALSPATIVAGSTDFLLTVNGTNFVRSSAVRWNGSARTTTFVSATQLRATIPAGDITSAGSATVSVVNASPGGGTVSATFTITPPPLAPTLTSISPASLTAGTTARTITVTGANFVGSSVVQVDGTSRPTTYVSATQLTVTLTPSDVATGSRALRVYTAPPGGGTSSAATLTVVGPALTLDRTVARPGDPFTTTLASGSGVAGEWLGLYPVGATAASAWIDWQWTSGGQGPRTGIVNGTVRWPSAGQALRAGDHVVRWWGAGNVLLAQSAVITITDQPVPAAPTLSSLDPPSVVAGSPGFAVGATGSGFTSASVIRIGGVARTTTVVSTTRLTATIAANEIASVGTLSVTAYTPPLNGLGGGESSAVALAITAPPAAPTLTSISPASLSAGTTARTLTITGTNFVPTSVGRFDGAARPTTYVSATQLTAVLNPADVVAGTHAVSVFTPAPGGGTSNAATLTIVGPSLTLDRTVAGLSGPFTATLTNGSGTAGEWLGLYPVSATATGGWVDWQWTSGGQGARTGVVNGTVRWPSAGQTLRAGDYVVRWWGPGNALLAQSAVITITDQPVPPTPTLTSIDPPSVVAGSAVFTLRATGTGFTTASVIRIGGAARTTTFGSTTTLTTVIAASEIASVGALTVTVYTAPFNGLGGGESGAVTLAITAPPAAPTLTSISPTTLTAGTTARTLTITGTNFVPSSVGRFDGTARPTTYISPTQLTVVLSATDIVAGSHAITVFTPAPGGGTSNAATLTISGPTLTLDRTIAGLTGPFTATLANGSGSAGEWLGLYPASATVAGQWVDWQWTGGGQGTRTGLANGTVQWPSAAGHALPPGQYVVRWWGLGNVMLAQSATITLTNQPVPPTPTLTSVDPPSVVAGGAAFPLRATGAGFTTASVIRVGGTARATTFGSATSLTTPSAGQPLRAGDYVVRWWGLGNVMLAQSATITLTNQPVPPTPTLTSVDPPSVVAGSAAFTLRVTGMDFTTGSVIRVGGTARTTAFGSATSLTTTIAASEIASVGALTIAVYTPPFNGLGGGESSAVALPITAPPAAPTLTTITPTTLTAGTTARTLTITGTNFVPTSVGQLDGAARPTTYVSATQLTTVLNAADVVAGTRAVTVFTRAPGGGTSNAATLTIVGPSLTLDRTNGAVSGPFTTTLSSGSGTTGEWLGLYRVGATAPGQWLDWQWTNGGQGTRAGVVNGTVTWPSAGQVLPAGTYVVRWWGLGNTLLAESAVITLAAP